MAPDLAGFGGSPLPDYAFTFEHHVDAVLGYLTDSKIENAIWCGISMGGYLALRMFERAPENCRALILCNTKAGPDGNEAKLKRWESIKLSQTNRPEFEAANWTAMVGESVRKDRTVKARFDELISRTSDKGIAAGLTAMATRTDSTSSLSKIRVPTLVVVGEEDKVTPVNEAQLLSQGIAGSQLEVIRKTGHLSCLENPSTFNHVLSGFLSSLK